MALPDLTDEEYRVDTVWTTCFQCGRRLQISIERGTRPPPKMCSDCRSGSHDYDDVTMSAAQWDRVRRGLPKALTPTNVKIFRPGDRGFKTRAAQVTPISEIHYERSQWHGDHRDR